MNASLSCDCSHRGTPRVHHQDAAAQREALLLAPTNEQESFMGSVDTSTVYHLSGSPQAGLYAVQNSGLAKVAPSCEHQ